MLSIHYVIKNTKSKFKAKLSLLLDLDLGSGIIQKTKKEEIMEEGLLWMVMGLFVFVCLLAYFYTSLYREDVFIKLTRPFSGVERQEISLWVHGVFLFAYIGWVAMNSVFVWSILFVFDDEVRRICASIAAFFSLFLMPRFPEYIDTKLNLGDCKKKLERSYQNSEEIVQEYRSVIYQADDLDSVLKEWDKKMGFGSSTNPYYKDLYRITKHLQDKVEKVRQDGIKLGRQLERLEQS